MIADLTKLGPNWNTGFVLVIADVRFEAQDWPEMREIVKRECQLSELEVDAVWDFLNIKGFCCIQR